MASIYKNGIKYTGSATNSSAYDDTEIQQKISDLETSVENIENGTTTVGKAETLEGLNAKEIGASGARNLIPYPYYSSTYESGGITFTDNGDGTITVNGTNNSGSALWFNCRIRTESSPWSVPNGTYVLSGCPKGGGVSTFRIHFGREVDSTFLAYCTDFGDSAVVDVSDNAEKMQIQIGIAVGATVDNLTFKPMLEVGSIAHDYVPYNYGNCETLCGKTVSDFAPSTHFITDPNDSSYSAMQAVVDENIYRLQIQNNGEAHFYTSTDNGANWEDKGNVIHSGNVANFIGNNNVRYNEETDFLQVFFNNSWIDIQKLNLQSLVLYVDGSNGGQFVAYAGNTFGLTTKEPTLTLGDNLTVSMSATDGTAYSGSAISKAIDLTAYNKLTFTHNSTSDVNSEYHRIQVHIVTQKASSMSMYKVLSDTLLLSQTSNSGEISMDISGLSGEHYITIEVSANNTSTVQTVISNMVLTV